MYGVPSCTGHDGCRGGHWLSRPLDHLFLLFDIETVFFYPWAVVYKRFLTTGEFILIEMMVFVFILLVGYIYVIRRGALEWE